MGGLSRLVLQHRAVSAVLAQRASLCTSSSRHEKTREFRKVMIANRGEIAIRVFRVVVLLRLAIPSTDHFRPKVGRSDRTIVLDVSTAPLSCFTSLGDCLS
uniref:Secreted protein n=1 Tax=Plectus sambesii TaxID=2011161 RepID=A0A914WWU4_9BILA